MSGTRFTIPLDVTTGYNLKEQEGAEGRGLLWPRRSTRLLNPATTWGFNLIRRHLQNVLKRDKKSTFDRLEVTPSLFVCGPNQYPMAGSEVMGKYRLYQA